MLLVRRASSPAPWSSSSRSFTSSSRRRLPDAGPPSAKPTNPGFSAPLAGSSESSGPQPGRARGPNNLVALGLFVVTGVGLYFYFANEKEKVLEKKKQDMATKSVGRVRVGGPFELVDVRNGQPFSEKDLLGKFSLLYVSSGQDRKYGVMTLTLGHDAGSRSLASRTVLTSARKSSTR